MTTMERKGTPCPMEQQSSFDELGQGNHDKNRKINPKIVIEFSETETTDLMAGEENTEQEPEEEQKRPVPDGGYGWFIVLGCFISHIIIGSLERSDGIFFLEFRKKFGLSAQITSLPGALVSATRLFFGPIATIVCNRYSVRSSCIIGSLLVFLGLFLDGYAPSFYFLFLCHFLIQGIGRGLVYGPGLFIVGMYFDKRRGIATGLSTSGVGVGTFLLVPLSQLLFDTYGFRWAFSLIAAISLNLIVCAMLYRPLSLHYYFTKGKEEKDVDDISLQEGLVLANAVEASDVSSIRSWKAIHSSKLNISNISGIKEDSDIKGGNNDKQLSKCKDNSSVRRDEGCLKSSLRILFPVDTYNKNNGAKKKVFHFYLLKDPSFLVFCLSFLLFTAAFKSAFTFIPAQVKSLGYTESEAAMVLSISGVLDTFGRIFLGAVFDLKCIKQYRPLFYTLFIFFIAAVSFIVPMLESYVSICIVCGLYGVLTGGFIAQKSVVIVDIVGAENIANSFGLLICFQGMGMVIGPPTSGALRDATGDFDLAFQVGGAFMLCAGFFMVLSNVLLWRRQQKERREKAEKQGTEDVE